jgi:hypothetical protein
MYYNRAEFMLLSRGGRLPPATGEGPPGRLYDYGDGQYRRLPPGEPWLLQLLRAAVRGMVRQPRAGSYADRDSYRELEFAVGFGADDEPWL